VLSTGRLVNCHAKLEPRSMVYGYGDGPDGCMD
jgi:hypothetical protein